MCTIVSSLLSRGWAKLAEGTNYSSISKYRGFGVYPMKEIEGRREMLIARINAASLFSLAGAQHLLKPLLWVEIPF